MNALYNFAVGPLAWIAFTVCIGGMIWRLWSLGRLARQRDASALAYMNWKDSLTSIIRWTLPFSTCGWRENPLLTVANFVPLIQAAATLHHSLESSPYTSYLLIYAPR